LLLTWYQARTNTNPLTKQKSQRRKRLRTQYTLTVRALFGQNILDATFGRMDFTQLFDMQSSLPFVLT
jgi:hypothetical protein